MSYSEDNSISHDITTDAGFRAWATKIHDALVAVGLVELNDTGEIDLSTVSTPASNSTYGGFEVFRFNDSQQGSYPIFLKVEYGRGLAAARPALRITAGTATNGSGTLTNPSAAVVLAPVGTPANFGRIHVSFLSSGSLTIHWAVDVSLTSNSSNGAAVCVLERARKASGATVGENAIILFNIAGGGAVSCTAYVSAAWSSGASNRAILGYMSAAGNNSTGGDNRGALGGVNPNGPVYPFGRLKGALVAYFDTAEVGGGIARGDTVDIEDIDGETITYKRPRHTVRWSYTDIVSTISFVFLLPAE